MPELEFGIKAPYNFTRSLKFCQRSRFEIVDQAGPNILRRVLVIDTVPLLVEITAPGSTHRPRGHARWRSLDGRRVKCERLLPVVKHILAADLDLKPFYRLVKQTGRLRPLVEKLDGLKPILTPTPFEAAAWAIMGQQVNLNFAYTLKKRLVEKYGQRFPVDGTAYFAFPLPESLFRVRLASLRKMQFSERKAEYMINLIRLVKGDPDFLGRLNVLSYKNAIEQLLSVRGFGIWSANYILMRGVGHTDCLPLGDSGLTRAVEKMYELDDRPDNDTIERLAAPLEPYRSLYTLYLWFYLMEGI